MGIRGELFTTQIQAENRTYFFNVKENTKGDVFLQVVESKATEGVGFDRHAVIVFEDEMQPFLQGLDKCIEFIERNRKERAKKKTLQKSAAVGKTIPTRGEDKSRSGKVRIIKRPKRD